jgi:hypothetical protein
VGRIVKLKRRTFLLCCTRTHSFLSKKQIEKKDFEKELKVMIGKKIDEGFKRDELTIVLKVDENTRRGDIADIETSMRRLNVRKVTYSVFGAKTNAR